MFREFKSVSLLREAHDSSDHAFTQRVLNPRLDLIEKAYADRLEKQIKILREALKALPRLNQKRGYPTGPEWQFLLDVCDQALSDAEEVE